MKQTQVPMPSPLDELETRLSSLNKTILGRLSNGQEPAIDLLIEELVYEYAKVNPFLNTKLISEAARISYDAHEGYKRKSGLPYIVHPYQVGYILALMGMDSETVAAGLNHDAIEKSAAKRKDITERIGSLGGTVLKLVMGVTRIPEEEIYSAGYDVKTQDKILRMMKEIQHDARIDAINVADGISNLLSIDGLRAGPNNVADTRLKSLHNSEVYVVPAALRFDNSFGAERNLKFYDFVNLLIQRGKANL